MLKTLYGKLASVLAALLALLGAIFLLATLASTRAFFAEVNQGLHHDLAAHLLEEAIPLSEDGVDPQALEHIFHMLMVVNPSIEVYLLDRQGAILAYSAPSEAIVREAVALAPIERFLSPGTELPVWGEDPRHASRRRVFSAAPVGDPSNPRGYLYVVLGGEQLDSAVAMVRSSEGLSIGLAAIALLVLFALATGLVSFAVITRRLRRLDRRMHRYRESGFGAPPEPVPPGSNDEIRRLEETFQEMASRLTAQLEELRETDRLRRELVANVSHDLRTPLTSLQGYLETLRVMGDLDEEKRSGYLDVALRQTRRLSRLVSELLELARLDSAAVDLHRETFALNELVQDVVQEFQLAARERGVELRAELPPGLARVDGDVGLISRALENLVDNGLRHTPANGSVVVRVTTNGEHVGLTVQDSGCGIDKEDLPLVFERFFGSRTGNEEETGGAGLGLAITRRIVELHGSEIEVESEPGAGSSFRFQLAAAGSRP